MKFGIGVITYNRPNHIKHWVRQVQLSTPREAVVHIAADNKDRKGVAYRTNECIKDLYDSGCDYIALFNDDCFPYEKGWTDFFIDAHLKSGQHHFSYTVPSFTNPVIESKEFDGVKINKFNNCNGCFMFITREVVDKVGGLNKEYGMYGFEHAGYSNRIHMAGLTPFGAYTCPDESGKYIYSLDLDWHKKDWHKMLKHKGSMSVPEAMHHVRKNEAVYKGDNTIYRAL